MEEQMTCGVTGTPNFYQDVIDWIQEYQPELITDNEARETLYISLYLEEVEERKQAEYKRDIVEAYDGICDIVRTAFGINNVTGSKYANKMFNIIHSSHYNIDCFHKCRQEVKRSNRTKSKDRREDGKIIKGPNYQAPNLLQIIKKYHEIKNP